MTTTKHNALKNLLDELSSNGTHLEVVEYSKGRFDWDVTADSKMRRCDVVKHADRVYTGKYEIEPGWLYEAMDAYIANGDLAITKEQGFFMTEVVKFLEDNRASVILRDDADVYSIIGLNEDQQHEFDKLIDIIAKTNEWFADWFIIEAKRLRKVPQNLLPKYFRIPHENNGDESFEALEFTSKILKQNSSTLYFWQEASGMIITSTDDPETDTILSAELSQGGYAADIETVLAETWAAADCKYDNIRFRVEDEFMMTALINRRLVRMGALLLINKDTDEYYFEGKEDSLVIHAAISTFASLYAFDKVSLDFIQVVKSVLEKELCYSNCKLVANEEFPVALPSNFQRKCADWVVRAKTPAFYMVRGDKCKDVIEAMSDIADDAQSLALLQVSLSIFAEQAGVSLSYLADKEIDTLLSYNYVDNGAGVITVVQDYKEVII